ncbi:MAG: hypothetical protein ACHQ4H_11870, partial [Ktedonobacterales bacterium]
MDGDVIEEGQLPGKLLRNRYRLDTLLERGATALVYRGSDAVLKRALAVKVVPLADAAPYREALKITAGLTHPAVVAVYDTLDEHDSLFI